MKRRLHTVIYLLLLTTASSFAEPRGWGIGLGFFDGEAGAQARKDFVFGPELQYGIALQAGLFNQHKVTGRFDADFHWFFNPDAGIQLYPLAGLDWAVQNKYNRAGVNIGGGAMFDLNAETRLFLEAKYVAGDWDGFAFTAGVYF